MALVARRLARNQQLQAAATNSPPLKKGASGEAVVILQRALIDLGFAMPISTSKSSGLPDGIYGDETVGTVRDFQVQQGLQPDGIAGHDTLGALDQIYVAEEAATLARRPFEARANVWT
jgi:peptidoglycan hydrolase-like protein with peptidoglycan-binding domain